MRRPAAALIALSAVALFLVSPLTTPLAGAAIIAGTALWGIAFAWLGVAHLRMLRPSVAPNDVAVRTLPQAPQAATSSSPKTLNVGSEPRA